jgi:hypothetical protein
MLYWEAIFLSIALLSHQTTSVYIESRPSAEVKQYVLNRGPNRDCSLLYIRTIPLLRTLTSQNDTAIQILRKDFDQPANDEEHDNILVYGYEEQTIALEISKQCSSFSLDWQESSSRTQLLVNQEANFNEVSPLLLPTSILLDPPPQMEVTPLHTSGHPSNRVDLVFFGDGCRYTLSKREYVSENPCLRYFRRKAEIFRRRKTSVG